MRPRPRTQKKGPRTALPSTDPLEAKDRNAQGPRFSRRSDLQKNVFAQKRVNFPENSSVLQEKNVFKIFFASSLAFSKTKQNLLILWPIFNQSKNSAVLEPSTGYFRGLAAFEAKDLTFEAKSKDCKLCPRGLHFW